VARVPIMVDLDSGSAAFAPGTKRDSSATSLDLTKYARGKVYCAKDLSVFSLAVFVIVKSKAGNRRDIIGRPFNARFVLQRLCFVFIRYCCNTLRTNRKKELFIINMMAHVETQQAV